MSPITHLLLSWAIAERSSLGARDRKRIAWAGVAPDADGLGLVIDVVNRAMGGPETQL